MFVVTISSHLLVKNSKRTREEAPHLGQLATSVFASMTYISCSTQQVVWVGDEKQVVLYNQKLSQISRILEFCKSFFAKFSAAPVSRAC